MLVRAALLLVLSSALGGCVADPVGSTPMCLVSGATLSAVVYGTDDRQDVYRHPDETLRGLAYDSIVAVISPRSLDLSDPWDVRVTAPAIGEELNLCEDQRFYDQPKAAQCSGTLIDDDLVLTAGHCIKSERQCRSLRFVFNYRYESEGRFPDLWEEDVFSCRRVVVRKQSRDAAFQEDYAIIQLDRPATPRFRPAPLRPRDQAMRASERLSIVGFGSGVPAKIDDGARVVEPREGRGDYYLASTDSFAGNSGSGVFDASYQLAGTLVRGATDYVDRCGCMVVNQIGEGAATAHGESVSHPTPAIDALCALGWPSDALCRNAASCGDGWCSGTETNETCSDDCDPYECGNGVCELGEVGACDDCSDRGPRPGTEPQPAVWECAPEYFDAFDGCDCGCGAYDPDCNDPSQEVLNCTGSQVCGSDGRCHDGRPPEDIPSGWTCEPEIYAADDGCDCDCGAVDPDCALPLAVVFNCDDGDAACVEGRCVSP